MFYSITIPQGMPVDVAKYKLKKIAREHVVFYTITANDLVLEKLLKKSHTFDLKTICYNLIKNMSFSTDGENIIIKFKDKDDDKLARLITYGDGKVKGSTILRDIFGRKGN
jgi:hypothetical protein